jgi:hypothetical protein
MDELDEALHALHREARQAPARLGPARAALLAALDADPTVTAEKPELALGAPTVAGPVRTPGAAQVIRINPGRVRVGRRLLIAAAVAGLAAAGTVGYLRSAGTAPSAGAAPSTATPPMPVTLLSAAAFLNKAADLTVGAQQQPLGPGQFRYLSEHAREEHSIVTPLPADAPPGAARPGASWLIEQTQQTWIPADYRQTWLLRRDVTGAPTFLGGSAGPDQPAPPEAAPTDRGEWRGACGDFFPDAKPRKVCGDPADWSSPAFYQNLPRDPDALLARLRELSAVKGTAPQVAFFYGVSILRDGLMPPDLRAQWYRALAEIPGVTISDTAANLDGRTGVALGMDDGHERHELIIDQATGDLLGVRVLAGAHPDQPWIKPGTVIEDTAVRTAVVDSLGQLPPR